MITIIYMYINKQKYMQSACEEKRRTLTITCERRKDDNVGSKRRAIMRLSSA